jgi:hypothetical protein
MFKCVLNTECKIRDKYTKTQGFWGTLLEKKSQNSYIVDN